MKAEYPARHDFSCVFTRETEFKKSLESSAVLEVHPALNGKQNL